MSEARTTEARPRRWALALAALTLAATHAALIRHTFGWPLVPGIVYNRGDFATHAAQVRRVLEAWQSSGATWAYDVQLLAGAPNGVFFDADNKAWELWTWALMQCGLDQAHAFNSFALLVHLAFPPLIYLAARLFRLSPTSSLGATGLAMALWWFDSFTRWNWFVGMLCYVFGVALALPTLALFHRWLEERRMRFALAAAPMLALAHLVHPYVFFVLAAPMLALYYRAAWRERSMGWSEHAITLAIAAFTLLVNGWWLSTAFRFFHYIIDSAYFAQGGLSLILTDFLGIARDTTTHGVIGPRTSFRVVAFVGAVMTLRGWRASADRRWLPFVMLLAPLAIVTYLGVYTVAAQVQPYRHAVPLAIGASLPAGDWLCRIAESRPWRAIGEKWRGFALLLALLSLQQLSSDVLYFFAPDLPAPQHINGSHAPIGPLGHGYTHAYRYDVDERVNGIDRWEELIAWIESHDGERGRWLVRHQVLGEYLMARTHAQIIGGFTFRNLAHSDAHWFRQQGPAPPYDSEQMRRYLDTYGVRWVVLRRQWMRPWWEHQRQLFRRAAIVGDAVIYEVVEPTPLLMGEGEIEAEINEIRVSGSRPDRPLELRFHWMETLVCVPECTVERLPIEGDRVGFIRVPAPHPAAFRIVNSYR